MPPVPYEASLLDAAEMIARRAITATALAEGMLERVAAIDPALNSYVRVTADAALEAAGQADRETAQGRRRGPLHGVPIAVKDIFHAVDGPSTFGSPAYRDFAGAEDATIIARLRMAGAVILGRLHLHEGAFGEHHPEFGRCINPWNADYWPGGSSSGSGAAVAARLCFASLGTDTGGSIRFPCAANGVTGLKPTWGRTSRAGVFALADSLDTIGPMARSAADCAAMLGTFAGPDPRDPTALAAPVPDYLSCLDGIAGARNLRLGIDETYLEEGVDAETVGAIRDAIAVFRMLGARIVPVRVPARAAATEAQTVIMDAECALFHRERFREAPERFGRLLSGAIERGLALDPMRLATAYVLQDRFRGELASIFEDVDALVSPVYPMVGARYDEMDALLEDLTSFLGFTAPFNMAGSPSVTLPCGLAAVGMPIGLQLIGAHLDEPILLRLAHAFQQATDWHARRPPVS